jgi:hypothetical protein
LRRVLELLWLAAFDMRNLLQLNDDNSKAHSEEKNGMGDSSMVPTWHLGEILVVL